MNHHAILLTLAKFGGHQIFVSGEGVVNRGSSSFCQSSVINSHGVFSNNRLISNPGPVPLNMVISAKDTILQTFTATCFLTIY